MNYKFVCAVSPGRWRSELSASASGAAGSSPAEQPPQGMDDGRQPHSRLYARPRSSWQAAALTEFAKLLIAHIPLKVVSERQLHSVISRVRIAQPFFNQSIMDVSCIFCVHFDNC